MRFWTGSVLFLGFLMLAAAGCGEAETFDHSDVAKLFIEAMRVRPTDQAKCVDLLTQVLDKQPMEDAYFHRGWIYAKQGAFDKASADVTAGLAMAPEHSNLLWLDGELKKPADKRSFEKPPSASK